jgi:putative addiction module component (TIGR02574 family)
MNIELLGSARKLSLSERVELFDAIWETLQQDGYEPPLSAAQEKELDHRLEAHRQNPHDVVSWEEIQRDVERKFDRGS